MRSWARNETGIYKVEKERFLILINEVTLKVKASILDVTDSVNKRESGEKLEMLFREEEIKWVLKAKV